MKHLDEQIKHLIENAMRCCFVSMVARAAHLSRTKSRWKKRANGAEGAVADRCNKWRWLLEIPGRAMEPVLTIPRVKRYGEAVFTFGRWFRITTQAGLRLREMWRLLSARTSILRLGHRYKYMMEYRNNWHHPLLGNGAVNTVLHHETSGPLLRNE